MNDVKFAFRRTTNHMNEFTLMPRRTFLMRTAGAGLGLCLPPLATRAQSDRSAVANRNSARPETLIRDIEQLIPRLMREAVVPGLSIALILNGKLYWHRGFGVKDAVSKEPVDGDSIFEAASVSKTVFAYAVMKLCEKGVIGLDTPLTRYAPKPFLEGDPRLEIITARHVLSHGAGFQNWRTKEEPLKIHFTPGTRFLYSGEGYYYLQSVVTHLKGSVDPTDCARYEADIEVCATDIDSFLKRSLLTPFGMNSSGYLWNESFERNVARPHDVEGKPIPKEKPTAPDAARYASAGGLLTTATDYAKFLIEILDPKESDAFRLTGESLREMLRPQVKLEEGEQIDGADGWALGWAVQQRQTGDIVLHSGGQTGFRSLTMASVKTKSAFVIFTNGDNGGKVIYDSTLGEILNQVLAGSLDSTSPRNK